MTVRILYGVALLVVICCLGLTEGADHTAPTFTNCPSQKIVTKDPNFSIPTLHATDDSGATPTITKVKGPTPPYSYGAHIFEFKATDGAGNSYTCTFMLEVQGADCVAPTSTDADMKFTCNGHEFGSICQLSCRSGTYVEGDKYIRCVTDTSSSESKSHWKPVHGNPGKCYKAPCPALKVPVNGAMVCDTTVGGTLCQMMCERSRDILSHDRFSKLYTCAGETPQTSVWAPFSDVPDCIAFKGARMHMPNKDFYFDGTCQSDVDKIKEQFIANLGALATQICHGECKKDQFKVRCGAIEATDDSLWN